MIAPSLNSRNPSWTRDELILALDFYLEHAGNPPGKMSKEIDELSHLLNRLGRGLGVSETFRNPNGVYMKAMNFRRLDPVYQAQGRVGLQRGNKDEEVVWTLFAHDKARLAATAEAIRANVEAPLDQSADAMPQFEEAEEGRLLTVQHVRRERDRRLVEAKKESVLANGGGLVCEACGFDYAVTYGERGQGYIEVHHVQPLSSLKPRVTTHLTDLALVCASCHRMIHATAKWLTMDELRSILRK